ncbi:conserved hypothetical protein [Histoplasma capsulatum var. duboisii H88]|uniref:Uncharacterized protein n=1 Tax=Ajellomyces capsulatus (strain H88) TaxID=544711 RepID=F0UNM2_AJEC8|nr:conserved hypothetical protein [Histoplasma capsulatum var. duboisii H88]QSS53794.1 hypothetical protein I7I53_01162 [Histoplasma capsulatum var. duboisii H88]
MPRTLPWQVGDKQRKSTTPSTSSTKWLSKSRHATGTRLENTPTPKSTPPQILRTPSTSPPLELPPVEFMKEGLDNDDQYIMVEDEFLATAQTFTRHLHHAEYVRKKNEAKAKNAKVINALVRPTSTKSILSAEAKKNMQSEENSMKHKAALSELKRVAGRPPVDSEVEDEGLESEEDKFDDPWMGTSLQNLMTHQRKHLPLLGLHGIRSTTRAALGFSKAPVDLPGKGAKKSRNEYHTSTMGANVNPHMVSESTDDDDDLDAQPQRSKSVRIPTPKQRPASIRSNAYTADSLSVNTNAQPASRCDPQEKIKASYESGHSKSRRHSTSAPPKHTSRIMRLLDDPDDEQSTEIKEYEISNNKYQHRKRSPSETSSNKRHGKDAKSKKSRLNEVPTFIL